MAVKKGEKRKKEWVDVTFDEKNNDEVESFLNTYPSLAGKAKIYADSYGCIHVLVHTNIPKEELEV